MSDQFDVYLKNKLAGKVIIHKQGCYYVIDLFCPIPLFERYHLIFKYGDKVKDLGVCVPYTGGFGLKTRIKIENEELIDCTFILLHADSMNATKVYPVYEDKPFDWLEDLEFGFLKIENGILGIEFSNQRLISISKPTGQ